MPASYPASLPVKNAAGANLSTDPHSALHDGMYDEIVAIATELGTAPKGTYASVKARLDTLTLQTNRISCVLTHSVGQSITSGLATAVTFDTETFDTGGLHSGAAPTKIIVPAGGGGLWQFSYAIAFAANVTGVRSAWLQVNVSASDRRALANDFGSATWDTTLAGVHIVRLNATDSVEVAVNQTSGGALDIRGNATAVGIIQFAAVRLGD